MVKTGQQWSGLVVTKDSTGALATPSVGPAGALYVDGVANGAGVTISGANPYKWTVTLPALTAGQSVSMYITATVATIATASVVAEDIGDTNRLSDIDISATGEVGLDFNNIKAATAPTTLTNIVVPNVTTVTGNVNGDVSGNLTGDVFGDVQGSVLGNVTNLLGNVNGKVLGGGVGVISATGVQAQIPTDGIGAAQIAATAAQEIADQVWDEALAGHALVGSTGEALTTAASASGATPATLWAYATRTLTQSAAQVADIVSGSSITCSRGDTLTAALTGIGALTGYVSVDFTVKASENDSDAQAIIRIRKNASGLSDGLLTLNGATGTAGLGSITLDSEPLGNITITLAASATDDLIAGQGYFYDVQLITATAVTTKATGTFNVSPDITRAIV